MRTEGVTICANIYYCTGCPNIIMSARVYFIKTVNGCNDVSIMSPQDEQ